MLLITTLFIFSCSPTKYIEKGEYFLSDYKLITKQNEILEYDIDNYVKQKPNKKILGVYVYARVYNLIDPVKEKKREDIRKPIEESMNRKRLAKGKEPKEKFYWSRWLQKIGEEPVVYSDLQTENSSKQIKTLLSNNGYFLAKVFDSVKFFGKKAHVTYYLEADTAFKLKKFSDSINDKNIKEIVHKYLAENPVKLNENVAGETYSKLREAINQLLLNNGYFKFSKEYISFEIDTIGNNYQANVLMTIKNPVSFGPGGDVIEMSHEQFKLDKFYIYTDYEPEDLIKKENDNNIILDTVKIDENTFFLINKENRFTESVLTRGLMAKHDSLYQEDQIQSTFKYFGSLANFRLINIDFDESVNYSDTTSSVKNILNTHIKLTPNIPQSFTVELEGNMTSGRYGMGTNLNYRHLNIFGGAEILNVQFKVELNNEDPGVQVANSYFSETEYGINTSIQFPKLISPFKFNKLNLNYFPKTNFSLGYNFRYNSNYKRTIFSTTYGYRWRSNEFVTHDLNPMEFSLVQLKEISPQYLNDLFETQQFSEKYDHIILGSHYTYTYNSQKLKKNTDFIFLKSTSEIAGNVLNAINMLANSNKLGAGDYQREVLQTLADSNEDLTPEEADKLVDYQVDSLNTTYPGFYTLFGLPYAQYVKTDLDLRYYQIFNSRNSMVYRINTGVILPYGNSYYSPQEKQFFLGGASSMRAWQARTLGPGSYSDTVQIYQYGDIKLEMNLEYRFKLFWMIESALFVDAGNIWTINEYETDLRKEFSFNRFYKEIAIGTGVGFRFDFSFLIIRFDFGLKLRDPSLPEGNRWLDYSNIDNQDWTFNFGIGYPF